MAINFFLSSLLFVSLLCIKVIIFHSKAANFTVLKLISKQACSLQYYRDQIPICLSIRIRRYHRWENTYISENTTKNIAAVFSIFYAKFNAKILKSHRIQRNLMYRGCIKKVIELWSGLAHSIFIVWK